MWVQMSKRKGKTLELRPDDNQRFEELQSERGYMRAQFGSILLCYAMRRVDEAIEEFHREGQRRSEQRRKKPTPLRVASSTEPQQQP